MKEVDPPPPPPFSLVREGGNEKLFDVDSPPGNASKFNRKNESPLRSDQVSPEPVKKRGLDDQVGMVERSDEELVDDVGGSPSKKRVQGDHVKNK